VKPRFSLAVPLIRAGQAVGAIAIRRTEVRPFSDKQIARRETFANQAVLAIENTRLFAAEQASKRELTGVKQQTATAQWPAVGKSRKLAHGWQRHRECRRLLEKSWRRGIAAVGCARRDVCENPLQLHRQLTGHTCHAMVTHEGCLRRSVIGVRSPGYREPYCVFIRRTQSTQFDHIGSRSARQGLRRDRPAGEIMFYCPLTVTRLVRVQDSEQATGLAPRRRSR
jgi:hypothetical protein